MRAGSFRFTGIGLLAALVSVWGVASQAHVAPPAALQDELLGSKIIDGRYVLKVGGLQMNVTNFGLLGSMPGEDLEMSFSPSAQWPAGSGVEFLHVAALWVGARVNGLPKVSTAYPDPEFYPGDQTTDTMYSSFEGAVGGNRVQTAFPDDDGDGAIDEDPLDGLDNDGDGRVDEDFGAIGNQMLRCRYRDDYPRILVDAPDHYPLGVEVTQEAYQWEQPELSDAVALDSRAAVVGRYVTSTVAEPFAGTTPVEGLKEKTEEEEEPPCCCCSLEEDADDGKFQVNSAALLPGLERTTGMEMLVSVPASGKRKLSWETDVRTSMGRKSATTTNLSLWVSLMVK